MGRKLELIIPRWVRWTIYVALAITTIGGAVIMLSKGYAKAEPYIPATRQAVRTQRTWSQSEHEAIRGDIAVKRQLDLSIQMAILEAVDPVAAKKVKSKIERSPTPSP